MLQIVPHVKSKNPNMNNERNRKIHGSKNHALYGSLDTRNDFGGGPLQYRLSPIFGQTVYN